MTTISRTCYWRPESGNAVQLLAKALEGHEKALLENNGQPYSSLDMRIGIDVSNLKRWEVLLIALMKLDPRGGYFFQEDVSKAIDMILADEAEQIRAIATHKQTNPEAVKAKVAYYIRVMCSHVRIRLSTTMKNCSKISEHDDLKDIYDSMGSFVTSTSRAGKSSKCPMPFFSKDPDDDDEGEDADEIEEGADDDIIATYFDGYMLQALQLRASGKLELALWYEHSEGGTVKAIFEHGVAYDTEIPNVCLVDGLFKRQALEPVPCPKPKANVLKRPARAEAKASKKTTGEKVEAVEQKEQSDADEEDASRDVAAEEEHEKKPKKSKIRVVCVGAHGPDRFAIQIQTSGSDKAQLVEFEGKGKKDETFNAIKIQVDKILRPLDELMLVKGIPKDILLNLREVCRTTRDSFK